MKITEKLITRLWQSHLVKYPVADTGARLRIIFPGRVSNIGGCDFKDAVFTANGRIVSGNIEVHSRSSQWYSHGHHQNQKYNDIVLHVVWQLDSQTPTLLQNGQVIPTVCLSSSFHSSLDELLNLPANISSSCPAAGNHLTTGQLLTAAGMKRFRAKTASLRRALNTSDASQVVYRGIARALGYAQNASPCQDLAERLPISHLIEKGKPAADTILQALLLGYAGLLPYQRHRSVTDRKSIKLEKIWRCAGITETMKESDWCFFRVRPDNFPTRRLVALSCLISRYNQPGLFQGVLRLVKKAPAGATGRWLESGLVVVGCGYWQNHLDFGVAAGRASALIGYEKAAAIVINIILPFSAAWAEMDSDPKLKKKVAEIYRSYHVTGDNELTRYMKQQLSLNPNIRLSACQQQGLIQIFNGYCRRRNCSRCPISLSSG